MISSLWARARAFGTTTDYCVFIVKDLQLLDLEELQRASTVLGDWLILLKDGTVWVKHTVSDEQVMTRLASGSSADNRADEFAVKTEKRTTDEHATSVTTTPTDVISYEESDNSNKAPTKSATDNRTKITIKIKKRPRVSSYIDKIESSSSVTKQSPPTGSKKRQRLDCSDSDYNNTADTDVKPTKQLRINPKLILCDADYNGGEDINKVLMAQPSRYQLRASTTTNILSYSSPHDLKELFIRLNAGERI